MEVGETLLPLEGKDLSEVRSTSPPTRPLDVLTPSFHVPRSRHQFATKGVYQKELKAARAAGLRPEFTGHGTAYSNAVPDASGFACSNRQIPPAAEENFAAINVKQWENGAHCGECVEVWCEDAFCPTRFQPQVLKVYDLCPECKHGDLDLSFEAYEKVTGRWPHRLKIGWRWLSREQCNEYFDVGTRIRMDLKDHNKWYRGFYFSMLAERLESVKLNGRELTPSQFGFWEDHSGAELKSGPFHLELMSASGEVIETTVADVLRPTQFLQAQFGSKKKK